MDFSLITSPTLLVDVSRAQRNIQRMADKASAHGLNFRPHFKTHQSAEIGEWFRAVGVDRIAVSSVDMAVYFADAGWQDIAIAFPANLRELPRLNALAGKVHLSLLVDSAAVAQHLADGMRTAASVFIEVDVGDGRSGIPWADQAQLTEVIGLVQGAPHLQFTGLMAHAGHSYAARGRAEVQALQAEAMGRVATVKAQLAAQGIAVSAISVGDSPTCSLSDDFAPATEIRPGNFAFFDLMQAQIGACTEADIAVALACPVIAVYPDRGELLLHCGAVHLSKDFLVEPSGGKLFGKVALPTARGWSESLADCHLYGLSQEHGMVRASKQLISAVQAGDLLLVLPVHSCLTADLMQQLLPFTGEGWGNSISMMKTGNLPIVK